MENRNTILGINRKKINIVHRIMLIAMLHSCLIAPAQNMLFDYFNYKEPMSYSSSTMNNESKPIPSILPISQSILKKGENSSQINNKSEKDLNYTLSPDIQNGVIGVSDTNPLDDASDNLFKFFIKDLPKDNTKIFLTYKLFGVQDCNGVSRSINDRPSTGGYLVKNQRGWTTQREEIDLKWLKIGENKVMFGIPKEANYQYEIKNLKLEFAKEPTKTIVSTIVVNNPTTNYVKDNQLYVKGFLRNYDSNVKVFIEDTPLTLIDGEYEGFLKLTDAIKSRKLVVIKAFDDKGILGQELIALDHLTEADQLFVPEKIVERVATIAKAKTNVTLNADGASLAISDNVLSLDKEISISMLRIIDIAPLSSGMINVTKGGYAYRFLPDGTQFEKPVKLSLDYDESRLPKGHNANEIRTFYFDTQNKTWVALERDTINKTEKNIVSLTNHFTDYINGIIQTPESPETAGFTPTMMNDIKAVDPSSEMTIISPPEVSQKGDANISYPIKIPAGRKGMQPNLAIQYSNEGANGWLGQGWSLTIPAIAIDTRWGVPQFDANNESEIYTLGGEQLMYPKMPSTVAGQPANDWMPNRHNDVADNNVSTDPQGRNDQLTNNTKLFTPRKQGSFAKIERLGNATNNYYWKVTATDGSISWYGGKTGLEPNAVLKNTKGDIVHWGLYLSEDVFGNSMLYEYDNRVLTGQTGLNENLNNGVIFHIKSIKYNGFKGSDYKYEVAFNSSTAVRDDVSINQRLGIKQIEPYILDNIVVKNLATASPIRKYTLTKGTGFFKKSRLEAITEWDWDKYENKEDKFKEFYTHTFEYYNDVPKMSDQTTAIFTPGATQTVCNDCALDTDKDGVCDTVDNCPAVAGPASNKGCPIVKIECNKRVDSGGEGISTYEIELGTNRGTTGIGYSARNIPDKFEIEWNGLKKSSGYVGLDDYRKDLEGAGVSTTEIKTENPSSGFGVLSFDKTSDYPTTAIIRVTGSGLGFSGTYWRFISFCPGETLPTKEEVDLDWYPKPASTSLKIASAFTESKRSFYVSFPIPKKIIDNNTAVGIPTTIHINNFRVNVSDSGYILHTSANESIANGVNNFISDIEKVYPEAKVSVDKDIITIKISDSYSYFRSIELRSTNSDEVFSYSFTEISDTLQIKKESDDFTALEVSKLTTNTLTSSTSSTVNDTQSLFQKTEASTTINTTQSLAGLKFRKYIANLLKRNKFILSNGIPPKPSSSAASCPTPPLGNTDFLLSGYIPSFDSTSSLLGSSKTEAMSAGFYIGIGIGKGRFTKMTTFGAQFTWGNDESKGLTTLIDINGDGLEDMISKEGDALYYKKHLVNRTYDDNNEPVISHSFEAKKPIYGIDNFYRAFGRSKSTNFQATYGLKKIGGFVGKDKSKSKSETDIYFTDGNGDGLMDIVKDGVVYFNRLVDNNPHFDQDSQGTENLVITAATKTVETPAAYIEEDITIPAFDVVKVWEAPADGAIKIDNNIVLTDTTKEAVVTVEMKVAKENPLPCTDTDGDGVCDTDDDCPTIVGPANNKGCPLVIENPCGATISPNGGVGTFTYNIDLGTAIGTAGIDYNAYGIPDKFDILWNGVNVSSGYVSNSGRLSFYKTSAYPTTAKITVTGNSNTITYWNFTSFCPIPPIIPGPIYSKKASTSTGLKRSFLVSFPIPKKTVDNNTQIGIPTTIHINNFRVNESDSSYTLYSPANESVANGIDNFVSDIERTYPEAKVSMDKDTITIKITDSFLYFKTIDLQPDNGEAANSYTFTEISDTSTNRKYTISTTDKQASTTASVSSLKTAATAATCSVPNDILIDFTEDPNRKAEAVKSVVFEPGARIKAIAGSSFVARIVPCNPIIPPGTPYTPPCSGDSASLSLLYGDLLNASKTSVNNTVNTNCKGQSLTVKKGDRIYFRTHSVAKGNPPVNWNPKVEYTTAGLATITDANGHTPFSSSYSDGFVLSSKTPAKFPGESGTAEINWTPFTITPSDDLTYQIIQETVTAKATDNDEDKSVVVRNIIYSRVCNRNVPTTIEPIIPSPVNLSAISITAPAGIDKNLSQTYFYFKITSSSNADWKNSVWKPTVKFTANQTISPNKDGSSPEGNVAISSTVYPVPDYDIYKLFSCGPAFTKKDISTLNGGIGLSVKPNLAGVFAATDTGKINFVVKRGNTLIDSRIITISSGIANDVSAIPLGNSTTPSIEMMYTIDDSDKGDDGCATSLLNKLLTTSKTLATILNGTTVVSKVGKSEITLYQKAVPKMGSFFRQWGQFMYNPANVTGASPSGFANTYLIKEDALQVVEDQTKTNEIKTDLDNLETVNQDDENAMDGALQNIKDNHQSYMNKVAFLSANPSRENDDDVIIDRWIGFHQENYATDLASQATTLEQSVIDLKEEESIVTQQTAIRTGAYAISKYAKGDSKNFSAGINVSLAGASVGVNKSKSNGGANNTLSDYVDFNGDRYPDIVTTEKIQYTTKTGGLFAAVANNGYISTATSDSYGFGASGSFSKSSKGAANAKYFEGFNGNSGAGISGSFTSGNSITQRVWTDINGDGLADLLVTSNVSVNNVPTEVTNVTLNSGTISPNTLSSNWGTLPLFKSKSEGISAGLGVNKWQGSVEAGVSMTTSWNSTTNTLADINGDGLLDLVYSDLEANKLSVKINTGNKFVDMGVWNPLYSLNKDAATVATSVNAGVTFAWTFPIFGIPFKIPAIGINGTPYSISTNKTKKSITDFDGDGYPDLVSENEKQANNITVYHSKIRRTDMLKSVTNPFGGKFTIDYKVQPVVENNPNAKWAMSDLVIEDKYDKVNDGEDVYKKHFVYEYGKYDRRERDFYGYKTVKVEDYTLVSGTPTLYRTSVSNYYNESYFLNGLLDDSYVIKAGDATKKFSRTQNSYEIFKLNAANSGFTMNSSNTGIDPTTSQPLTFDVGGSEGRRSAGVLLTKTITELYELDSSPQLTTEVRFKYDDKGRVIEFNNIGNSADANDNYTSTITYWDDTNLNTRNIINVPKSIKVKVGSTTVRERETEIDLDNGNLKKIRAKNGTEWAITSMDLYDSYGNLKKIIYPATAPALPMTYEYEYDPTYNKYVTGIKDAFNYTSTAKYNSDFDKIEETTDLAGNIMKYEYDTFGRNTLILGPKEKALGALYTLKFEYYPFRSLLPSNSGDTTTNFVPVAVTKHYDVQRPTNPIETYTFIDGLARPIQVKKDIYYNNGTAAAPLFIEALSVSGKTLYDELGRAKQQFHPYWEPKADNKKFLLNETTNTATQYNTVTEYDELDRPVKSTDPDNNISTMQYSIGDVNGVKAIKTLSDVDQNGAQHIITETYKDVAGKVISTKNQGGTSGSIWTKFNYNAIGELMSYTDAENITTSYTYDAFGRKKTVQSPDSGLTTYTYDIAGNLRYLQTANLAVQGKEIEYIYDKNRLTNIKYPNISAVVSNLANVDYTYGSVGNQTGRLIKQKDATGLQTFDYDNMGNIITNERTIIGPNIPKRQFINRFTYDSWNRLQTMTYPDGEIVTYAYDLGGNLNKMTGQLGSTPYNYVNRIDYDYFEQKTYMKYGNNTETFYNYSPALRRLSNLNVKTATGTNLFNNAYGYDKIGNVLTIANAAGITPTPNLMGGNYNHTYTYDNLNRLASAAGSFTGSPTQISTGNDANASYSLSMQYNNTHGITNKNQYHIKNEIQITDGDFQQEYTHNNYLNKYAYKSGTHQVSSIINTDPNSSMDQFFGYDKNGNLSFNSNINIYYGHETITNYYWDESNRLRILVDSQNMMHHYIYDASGERVLKASSDYSATYENGTLLTPSSVTFNSYTTYPSAFMVVNANGVFSKHYYAGSQRIVSRLGDATALAFNCSTCPTSKLAGPDKNQAEDSKLQQAQIADLQQYMDKANKGKAAFKDYSPQLLEDQEKAIADEAIAENATEKSTAKMAVIPGPQFPVYFYHPDHLGTSTFLTDVNGVAHQFFLNLPYGETMAEQLGSNYYNTPYKFNGKELDADTGLYYYGARYYSPRESIWLSTDPLAEKYPEYSPYSFCFNNPVRFIDPDGQAPTDIVILGANKSSITVKTDLVDIKINASSLGIDFGGNYTLAGRDIIQAAADIGGVFDPTGALDVIGAKMSYDDGDYWGAGASALGVLPIFVGDLAKTGKIAKGIDKISDAIDAAKAEKKATGSYTVVFENGKKYHGKGPESRMNKSAADKATIDNPVKSKDWTPAKNDREAFKQESRRLENDGGHRSNTNYNKRDSPGTNYRKQDGD